MTHDALIFFHFHKFSSEVWFIRWILDIKTQEEVSHVHLTRLYFYLLKTILFQKLPIGFLAEANVKQLVIQNLH